MKKWKMENGKMENGKWKIKNGNWKMENASVKLILGFSRHTHIQISYWFW